MWFRALDTPHVTSFTRLCRGFGLLLTPQWRKGQESSHFRLITCTTRSWAILNTASIRDRGHMHIRLRYTTNWKISFKRWAIFKSTGCYISTVQLQFLDKIKEAQIMELCKTVLVMYEGWNFNNGNYFFYKWYKIDTCFEVLLSFNVVTSIVYNPLPAMWKS